LVDYAEKNRFKNKVEVKVSAFLAASSRLRPIIMTTLAMIAGMVPMAAGIGDGGEQVAPLGQAVIGGLLMSTLTTLLVLPHLFVVFRSKSSLQGVSLDPDDVTSRYASEQLKPIDNKPKIIL
jgi:multidrug efflux pump subunit AcrB